MAAKHPGIYTIDGKLWIDFWLNGKRHREWYSNKTHETEQREAEKYRKKVLDSISAGNFVFGEWFPNSKHSKKTQVQTLAQAAEVWLDSQPVKHNTLAHYKICMNFWLKFLGSKKITEIDFVMVRTIISQALGNCTHTPHTLNSYMVPLRGIFSDAKKLKVIREDPMDEIPLLEYQLEEPKPIKSAADIERIIAHLYKMHPQVGNYFGFGFFTGLRVSELIALEWPDIDFEKKPRPEMLINKAKTNGKIGSTKGKRLRRVPINVRALEYLNDQKQFTRLKNGAVFENPNVNRPWHSDKFQRDLWWNVALEELGIDRHRAYATRHSFASHLLKMGVPTSTITKQLGHSTVRTTERFYLGDIPDADGSNSDLIDRLLMEQMNAKNKDGS